MAEKLRRNEHIFIHLMLEKFVHTYVLIKSILHYLPFNSPHTSCESVYIFQTDLELLGPQDLYASAYVG